MTRDNTITQVNTIIQVKAMIWVNTITTGVKTRTLAMTIAWWCPSQWRRRRTENGIIVTSNHCVLWLSTLVDLWKYIHRFFPRCLKSLTSWESFPRLDLEWISWLPPRPTFPFVGPWCSCLPFSSSHSWERSQGLLADRRKLWGSPASWFSRWSPCSWMGSPPSWQRNHE